MPFYRIRIWLKNRKAPVQGIRFIELNNIEQVQNKIQNKAGQHYFGSQLIDVEVAMLSKNCSAVKKNLNYIMKKSVEL